MPGPSRFRVLTFAACAVTGTAAVLAAVAVAGIWHSFSPAAMADDRSAAVAASVIAGQIWAVRWVSYLLTGGAVGYMIDAMLTQRALYRKRLRLSGPLRKARPERSAPSASL